MSFDLRLHPQHLTDEDLETLRLFGVEGALCVADASPHPPTVGSLLAHFEALVDVELPRLERAGLKAWAALGVHPAVVPARGLDAVVDALPSFFGKGRVAALGLLGLWRGGPREEAALLAQLEVAQSFRLPVVVVAPALDRQRLTRRLLTVLTESGFPPDRVLLEGATASTLGAIHALGFHAALTLQPGATPPEKAVALVRKLGPDRLHLASGAGLGESDLLALPRALNLARKSGLSRSVAGRVGGRNAVKWLALPVDG